MTTKDSMLLSEAYLSIKKKAPATSLDASSDQISTAPNETVSVGPMEEPAPGVEMDMATEPPMDVSMEQPAPMAPETPMMSTDVSGCGCGPGCNCNNEEDEAHEMALDNLGSIRDSIMKIASHCGAGEHLPAWSLQKLAIAMDNLADVARALR
jgi:hypothetical protein